MDEQETTQEESEETAQDTNKRIQRKTVSKLDRADEIVEKQKIENDRREAILDREEALEARKIIGGELEAGESNKKEEEISPKEYAEKALSGDLNVKKE